MLSLGANTDIKAWQETKKEDAVAQLNGVEALENLALPDLQDPSMASDDFSLSQVPANPSDSQALTYPFADTLEPQPLTDPTLVDQNPFMQPYESMGSDDSSLPQASADSSALQLGFPAFVAPPANAFDLLPLTVLVPVDPEKQLMVQRIEITRLLEVETTKKVVEQENLTLQNIATQLEQENAAMEAELAKEQSAREEKTKAVENAMIKIKELRRSLQKITEEKVKEEKINALRKNLDILVEEKIKLTNQLNKTKHELCTVQQKIANKENELVTLKEKKQRSEEEHKTVEKLLEQEREQLKAIKKQIITQIQQIVVRIDEFQQKMSQLELAEQQIVTAKESKQTAVEELTAIKARALQEAKASCSKESAASDSKNEEGQNADNGHKRKREEEDKVEGKPAKRQQSIPTKAALLAALAKVVAKVGVDDSDSESEEEQNTASPESNLTGTHLRLS